MRIEKAVSTTHTLMRRSIANPDVHSCLHRNIATDSGLCSGKQLQHLGVLYQQYWRCRRLRDARQLLFVYGPWE